MSPKKSIVVAGTRDVRGTLTDPGFESGSASELGPESELETTTTACVVACPPHPQMGGSRSDKRLTAVSDELAREDDGESESEAIASLRFDYGEWAGGSGEYTDTLNAIEWVSERFDRVGLYGFSFGGTLALLAAAETDVACVSAVAPTARISESESELDGVDALDEIDCPAQVVYGERDSTADWEPVVERARALDYSIKTMSADHFFIGQTAKVAEHVVQFLRGELKR